MKLIRGELIEKTIPLIKDKMWLDLIYPIIREYTKWDKLIGGAEYDKWNQKLHEWCEGYLAYMLDSLNIKDVAQSEGLLSTSKYKKKLPTKTHRIKSKLARKYSSRYLSRQ